MHRNDGEKPHRKENNFFFGDLGSNPGPYIYYALSIPTELNS